MVEALLQDVRYSFRTLRRSPGFSIVVVATLALAIGATATLFSVLNAVLLRPLPVRDPARLAVLSSIDERGTAQTVYAAALDAFRGRQRAFESLAMYSGGGILRLDIRGAGVDGGVEGVTPEYFDLVGVRPVVGRLIGAADAPAGNNPAPVIVLGHRFWQRQFGGDPNVIGETVKVEGTPLTVIGVTQPGFYGLQADSGADFFISIATLRPIAGDPKRPVRARNVVGRLRAGVTIEQARAEAVAEWPAVLEATIPAGFNASEQRGMRAQRATLESIATGFSGLRRRYADPLVVLVGLSALLLAIGCVNLGGLLLARAGARHRELAVRMALGASRTRLVQQPVIQSLLLSAAGTIVALPLAWWASRLLAVVLRSGSTMPLAMSVTPDARVLGAAAVVCVAVGLIVGACPAWLSTRARTMAIAGTERGTAASGRAGKILLVVQIALSLSLLVGAGLFARSLARLHENDARFSSARLVWTRIWMQPGQRATKLDRSYAFALTNQLRGIAGVESVGFSDLFPSYFTFPLPSQPFERAGAADGAAATVDGLSEVVSPRFFETVGIARLQGRDFTWDDDERGAPVAIVNAALGRALFPDGTPIGRRVRMPRGVERRDIEIVGVVDDAPIGSIREPHRPVLFRPMLQEPQRGVVPNVHLRVAGNVEGVRTAFARVVPSLGKHFVRNVYTLDEQVEQSLLQERLVAALSSFFAALAMLLACLGVYGWLAYAVTRRTREIGIRMSLGATAPSVVRMIVVESAAIASLGVAVGIPCALAAGRFIRSLLYGLAPSDPLTLAGASAVFVAVAVAAGVIPAYRASRIDPMSALRCE